ncbi:hypothetical protein GCM10023194_29080 [Planotetraspora phitsanulokensis]|uniref:Uncharacterized protein n=1 Tax=Planotetraspora phitsanulokensis TaxID=575192 RepID=A0A8J3U4L4_9ACTN|nr:hypothetical protein [Planotetraspora phitsanulokensis]GII35954.1 hypothetical protein Pph01_09570 [Planotetraspora phitsanulokensis]
MAGHELIERHLQMLAERLPSSVVEELADGLTTSYEDQLERLGDRDSAARAALADFGDADTIATAFIRLSPGRGTAIRLLAIGPLVGLTWGAALVTGHTWAWSIPLSARLAFGLALSTAVLMLVVAVRERRHYQAVRLAALGGAGSVVILDSSILGTVAALLPPPSVLLLIALVASLVRILLVVRAAPALISRP